MHRKTLLASLAMAIVLPSAALAQETCEQRAQDRVAGTAVGAIAGALLGSAVAGHHDKAAGAVVGGVAGAVIGNQVAKGSQDCQHAYGWYDNDGRWHSNNIDRSAARGYYDRNGAWVEGQPQDYRPARNDWNADRPDRYDRGDDGRRADDYGRNGYPEFQRLEFHIRDAIRQGVRDDLIEPDDAHDLMGQLHDIQREEDREHRVHGWNLPPDDRMRIRAQLEQLDRQVDEIRDEP